MKIKSIQLVVELDDGTLTSTLWEKDKDYWTFIDNKILNSLLMNDIITITSIIRKANESKTNN